ncbi:hypothetical protein BDV12DRAFT_169832 [Aspergillus spectabilis]
MGNSCSSSKNETEPSPSSRPGRVLGSSTAPRASVPATAKSKRKSPFQSPGRTLGTSGATEVTGAKSRTETGTGTAEDTSDARARAALAAQQRERAANSTANKGKLGTKLAAQKAQTQAQTLNEVSKYERAARDADGAADARRWE